MNCKAAKKLIPAFVDGELGLDKAAALNQHLASCCSCQHEMDALKRTMEVMGVCGDIEASFTLADIRERAAQRRLLSATHRVSAWLLPLPRLATVAMVLVALAVGSISGTYHGSHISRQARSPSEVSTQRVSDSLGLDAFDDGLAGAMYVADAKTPPASEVTR